MHVPTRDLKEQMPRAAKSKRKPASARTARETGSSACAQTTSVAMPDGGGLEAAPERRFFRDSSLRGRRSTFAARSRLAAGSEPAQVARMRGLFATLVCMAGAALSRSGADFRGERSTFAW